LENLYCIDIPELQRFVCTALSAQFAACKNVEQNVAYVDPV